MWSILEHRSIERTCTKLPVRVVRKYELWKDLVFRHGPDKLREFPGFQDEKLKGDRRGQRASRLSLQYRVIYKVQKEVVTVNVIDINAHKY
jgi:mRNA-degrading endonuclease RelE of RelBE toxin-antitoxin system